MGKLDTGSRNEEHDGIRHKLKMFLGTIGALGVLSAGCAEATDAKSKTPDLTKVTTVEKVVKATDNVIKVTDSGGGVNVEQANLPVNETVIAETKAENPELAPFVDDSGGFDTRAAAKSLHDTGKYSISDAVSKARQMNLAWLEAKNDKATQVLARI